MDSSMWVLGLLIIPFAILVLIIFLAWHLLKNRNSDKEKNNNKSIITIILIIVAAIVIFIFGGNLLYNFLSI